MIKILIVDDSPHIQEIFLHYFNEKKSYNVVGIAGTGPGAVDLNERYKPDMIILDLALPMLSGLEAAPLIKKENPNVKIYGCSTLDQDLVESKKHVDLLDFYIKKPFSVDELNLHFSMP